MRRSSYVSIDWIDNTMTHLAIDIGGANLKAADGLGYAASTPFPLWQQPTRLAAALREVIAAAPPAEQLAITMTGELADCFRTKVEGVMAILDAAAQAAGEMPVRVYRTDGSLVSITQALVDPLLAAASNFHALARLAARHVTHGTGMLLDIGSTTSDLIPLSGGRPMATATTDTDRLISGELVYTGVERSPVCAVVTNLPWRGNKCSVAQELFATTWDAYLTLGDLPEQPQATHTADGRPATRDAALDRLARCICTDRNLFTPDDAQAVAAAISQAQTARLGIAAGAVLGRLPSPPSVIVISGSGEFLARRVIERLRASVDIVSLSETLGAEVSCCATAHALAIIARETDR